MLLTSENSMQGENYEHSRTGTCPYTSSAWRSFGLARRMAARGAVSQRSGVIRDNVRVGRRVCRCQSVLQFRRCRQAEMEIGQIVTVLTYQSDPNPVFQTG